MLSDIKKSYEEKASHIENYKTISRNELVDLYIKNESDPKLKEYYLSAIICRYWNSINRYHFNTGGSNIPIEECYDWVIRGVMDALERRPWIDPNSKIYNKKNGQDIAINQCILTSKLMYYQNSNYDKRRINYGLPSVDSILDDGLEGHLPSTEEIELDLANQVIKDAIKNKDYSLAFIVDNISYGDSFKEENNELIFDEKKLLRQLKSIDIKYGKLFAKRFNANPKEVNIAIDQFNNLKTDKLFKKLKYNLLKLRSNPILSKECD